MNEEKELAHKRALVTGAGRGIGRAVARALAARGATVVLVGRDEALLARTREIVAGEGGVASVLVADITGPEWLTTVDPDVDVLVHNAAGFAAYGLLEDLAEDEIGRVFDTILHAATRLSAFHLPGMKSRGFGRIVHIGSLAASRGSRGQVAYAAAKAGLEGLMRSTALEGAAFGVTSNLLELGLVDTERIDQAVRREVRDDIIRRTPVGRMASTEEAAAAVAFLTSPRASYITGAVLPVNGGLGLGLYPEQLG